MRVVARLLRHGDREGARVASQAAGAVSRRVVDRFEAAVAHGVRQHEAVDAHTFEPTPSFRFAGFERHQFQTGRLATDHVDYLLLIHHAAHFGRSFLFPLFSS